MRKSLRIYRKIKRRKESIYNKRTLEASNYTVEKVFSFTNFIKSLRKSKQNVSWKASVQLYINRSIFNLLKSFNQTNNGQIKCISCNRIEIRERGKIRIITPVHINDRVVQKVLCDNCLIPILSKKLIYDNGASLKGKGVEFTRKRVDKHVKNAIREFGSGAYALSFDFKDFFNSIPHRTCYDILKRYCINDDIVDMTMQVIKAPQLNAAKRIQDPAIKQQTIDKINNNEGVGICLGSQVSQVMALIVPNDIDHYIKDIAKHKYYIRYMDDGVVILRTKEECKALLSALKVIANRLGLVFNDKKTHIIKLSKGFTFLKVKYKATENGGLIKKLTSKGIIRTRRKLKKLYKKVQSGERPARCAYDSMQSWVSHSRIAKSYKTRGRMLRLYESLFGKFNLKHKNTGGFYNELLQTYRWAEFDWGCNG